ncbi:hypothetical protein ABZ281_13530 [Streptomyces sp. NPDC006265]|uniref:hypothetical protein n=1 Tax=Streptomyces sp. NPDC006265 TaxID=3156740 RepID=UPI0033B46B83
MSTGRYPAFERYALGATRKDDRAGEFALGLDCVLDGIGQRLGIRGGTDTEKPRASWTEEDRGFGCEGG